MFVRMKLTPDDVNPPNIRWDADCNCVQFSPDGGVTWTDTPGLDPRSASSFRMPPLSGGSAQCDAAARMAAYVRDQVNAFITSVGLAQAATAALELLLAVIPGVGWMVDAIIAALELLVTIGADVISAAFTDAVYDDLKCTFLCHIDANGQMSDSQLADFQADVEAHYSATVYATMLAIGSFSGAVAYSNAGVERSEIGDCGACECAWCYNFDFLTSNQGFSLLSAYGVWTAGVGWESSSAGGSNELLGIGLSCSTSHVIYCEAVINCVISNADNNGGVGIFNGSTYPGVAWSGGHLGIATHSITLDMPNAIQVLISAGNGGSGHFICTSMKFKGIGTNPFGVDNC